MNKLVGDEKRSKGKETWGKGNKKQKKTTESQRKIIKKIQINKQKKTHSGRGENDGGRVGLALGRARERV
jgi:hypothetical protein